MEEIKRQPKKSIRFFNDREVRLVSPTHGFKFEAPDGKLRAADVLNLLLRTK